MVSKSLIRVLPLPFALFVTLNSLFIPSAFAQTSTPFANLDTLSIGYSRLSPENPLYFLKAVREVLEIKFAGTENIRVKRRIEFATRRLKEVNSLIAHKREDLIQPNLEKFLYEVSSISPPREQLLYQATGQSLGFYMETLVGLYGKLTDPYAKLGIRSSVFRLTILSEKFYIGLHPPVAKDLFFPEEAKFQLGCNLLSKEASSSAINESEKQVLLERSERCNKTLIKISSFSQGLN